jgi:hypothetical protein
MAGRVFGVVLLETERDTGWGVATMAAGALALPLEPTVVQAPPVVVGTAGAALLANSAYLLPAALVAPLAAACVLAAA